MITGALSDIHLPTGTFACPCCIYLQCISNGAMSYLGCVGASQGCCQQAKTKQSPAFSRGDASSSVFIHIWCPYGWNALEGLQPSARSWYCNEFGHPNGAGDTSCSSTGLHHTTGVPPLFALLAPLREASKLPGCLRKLSLSWVVSFGPEFLSASPAPCAATAGKAVNAKGFILQVFHYSEAFDWSNIKNISPVLEFLCSLLSTTYF